MRKRVKKRVPSTQNKANDYSFLKQLTRSIPALVIVYNIQTGKYIYVNDAIEKILGYSSREFLKGGMKFAISLVHPDDLPRIMEQNAQALEKANNPKTRKELNKSIVTFEYRMRHKEGMWCWLHSDGVVFDRDKKGKVLHVMNASVDITERKASEIQTSDKILQSEARLLLAIDAGKIGVWDWDIPTNIITWTDQVYSIHGVKKRTSSFTFDQYKNFIHPEDRTSVLQAIDDALHKNKPYQVEFRTVRPDGKTTWVSTSAKVLFNKKGRAVSMLGASIDTTERKRLERQKDDFIAIASHELKTPVTSIKAFTQVLKARLEKKGEQNTASMLEKMDGQLNKLTNLIRDLLDTSKTESGKLVFSRETFDFNSLISEIVEEIQRTTKHKIIQKLAKTKTIIGDKDRIGQVITNFLSNAIKYSPDKKNIHINTSFQNHTVTLSVKDFGLGIPQDEQDKVFERFFRVNDDKHGSYPGLGLGLYISKEIIRRHDGDIWVKSTPGKGSVFSFSLPIG